MGAAVVLTTVASALLATTGAATGSAAAAPPLKPELCTTYSAGPAQGSADLTFEDVTGQLGPETLLGRYGHGAATGDVDNDGRADLFLGTFAGYPPLMNYPPWNDPAHDYKPDMLMLNRPGGFVRDTTFPEVYGMTSGVAFLDVDSDGDLDLAISKYGPGDMNQETAGETLLMRNDGGQFHVVEGAIPRDSDARIGGRSIGVLDYDSDGHLDLFVTQGGADLGGGRSNLLRNPGSWDKPWEDVTEKAGLPSVPGYGVTTQDLTGDGLPDLLVVDTYHRVFVNNGDGTFRASSAALPPPPTPHGSSDFYTGGTSADINHDGRNDVLLGAHYVALQNQPDNPGPPPTVLLINRGTNAKGDPVFSDETAAAGLPMTVRSKSAAIHVVDVDNDGFDDIVPGVGRSADRPAIFRNTGETTADGVPKFEVPDKVGTTPGALIPWENQAWVSMPHADFDHDGRSDFFLDYFFSPTGVHMIRNTTKSGHWLAVSINSQWGTGPGTVVEAYEPGGLGNDDKLISRRTISAAEGYASGVVSEARFGLGDRDRVDLRVTLAPGGKGKAGKDNARTIELRDVAVDRSVWLGGCPPPVRDIAAEQTMDVNGVELKAAQPLIGGAAVPVEVALVNRTGKAATASVSLRVPEGWTATTASVNLASGAQATATVTLTPPPGVPSVAPIVTTEVHAKVRGKEAASGWPSLFQVLSVPTAADRVLALDAGTADSAVADGFARLAPEDLWAEGRDAGWVGTAPGALDRNAEGNPDRSRFDRPTNVDALRSDMVYADSARTLRLRVPAGQHVLHVLTGDEIQATPGVTVTVDGRSVATPTIDGPRVREWTPVSLDGGESGRTVDVTFDAEGTWRVSGLVLSRG